jgi:NAD(P)-dependent dehydrogenase (short-subunit alcohol dehydrogenase family)
VTQPTAVVTGANGGIGYATAIALARRGMRVVLACRSEARGAAARQTLVAQTGSQAVEVLPLDLASLDSVRRFAEAFTARHPRLDLLVNNAGVFRPQRALTADGFELHFGVMYLGHFLLTQLLLDALRAAPAARVVTVSAWGHRLARLEFDDLQFARRPYHGVAAYAQAKLAQVVWTQTLAQRLAGTGVTAYSLHPGVIGTNLAGELPAGLAGVMQRVLPGAEQGAATSVYVATAPGLERFSGQYFAYRTLLRRHSRGPANMARRATDPAQAVRLWQVSEQLCGIATAAGRTLAAPQSRTTPAAAVSATR